MTLFLFQSTRHVIRAEKLCAAAAVRYRIVPVPKEVSAECGMAIEIPAAAADSLRKTLETENIPCQLWKRP